MGHAVLSLLMVAAGCGVAAGLWPNGAEASDVRGRGDLLLVVRTYTQPASRADLPTARRTAGAILERAGIETAWVECGVLPDGAARSPESCHQPLRADELLVRIVPAGAADGGGDASTLGFAFVDLGAGGGSLATVYADRVRVMAEQAGADAAELLGWAMAHEIGHLLLGTNRHAPHGLMRASWSTADLRRARATQWMFDRKEGDAMRRRIAGRLPS